MRTTRIVLRATARLYQRISAQLILLAAFFGLVWFLVYFTVNSSYAVRLFDGTFNSTIRGRIAWSRLSWGPLPWQIDILEPVLVGAHDRPIITAEAVRVGNFRLLELLRGRVAISGVVVEKPVVRLTGRVEHNPFVPGGEELVLDLPSMFKPPGPDYDDGAAGGPPALDFEDVDIRGARFTLDFPSVAVRMDGIDIEAARFEMQPPPTPDGERVMSMGARRVAIVDGEVRVAPGEGEVTAIARPDAEVLRFPVRDVRIDHYRWFGRQFTIARLAAEHRGDRLLISGYQMRLDTPGLPWLRARIHFAVDEIADHLAQFGVGLVRGPAVLTVDGAGEIDAFEGTVEVAGDRLTVGPMNLGQYAATVVKHADDRVELTHLDVNALDGRVSATGGFDLEAGRGWSDLWLRGIDVSALPFELPPDARVLAGGALRGPVAAYIADAYDDPAITVSADLRLERRAAPLYGIGRRTVIKADAHLSGAALSVDRLWIDAADLDVDARGALDIDTLDANLAGRVASDDLANVGAALDLPLRGEVDVEWRLSGTLTDPTARARIRGVGVGWADLPAADLRGRLDYGKGWLEFSDFFVNPRRKNGGELRVRGRLGVGRPGIPLGLDIEARQVALDSLALPVDVGGTVDATARLRGTAQRPKGSVDARVLGPRWQQLAFKRLDVKGDYDGRTLTVEELTLSDEGRREPMLAARGEFTPRGGAYTLALSLDRVPLSLAEQVAPALAEGDAPFPLRGAVSVTLGGSGTLEAPALDGTVTLHEIDYGEGLLRQAGGGELAVDARDGRVTVQGTVFDRFRVDLAVPLAPGGPPATAAVAFEPLRVEDVIVLPPKLPLETRVGGRISATFDPFADKLPEVTATLSTFEASYGLGADRFRVAAPEDVQLRLQGGDAIVDRLALRVTRDPRPGESDERRPAAVLDIGGRVALAGGAPTLALTAGGELDLAVVQPFATSVFTDITGRARLDLEVQGPLTEPAPSGHLDLVALSLVPRSAIIGNQIELIRPARLYVRPMKSPAAIGVCTGDRVPPGLPPAKGAFLVTLDPPGDAPPATLELIRDESPIHIERARLEFRRFVPDRIDVRLDAEDLALNIPRTLRATLDASNLDVELCQHPFAIGPPRPRLRIGGRAQIQRGEYTADITSASDINRGFTDNLRGAAQARTVSVFERIPLLQQLYFDDFRASCDGDFYIRNNVTVLALDLELRFGLVLSGLLTDRSGPDKLGIAGQMVVQPDSQLIYARRPFEVTTGTVIFGRDPIIDATLEATHTFRLRTDDAAGTSTTFDQGGSDIRLEEVTLATRFRLVDWESSPDLDIEMSSNSGLSSYEIAVLVLTGSLPDSLGGAAGAQPATEVLLGPLLGLIERPLEDTLDVDLSLTPASTGTLFIDADKLLSRRLRLYSRTLVGDEDGTVPQTFGLEYRINNAATAELSNEQAGNLNSTSGRLRLRLELD